MFECGSAGLQDSTDDHDSSSEKNDLFTAKGVADKDGDNGAEETAQVV